MNNYDKHQCDSTEK